MSLHRLFGAFLLSCLGGQALAASVYIEGDISLGAADLVISDDLVFDVTASSDPLQIVFAWDSGLRTPTFGGGGFVSDVLNSDFVETLSGPLAIGGPEGSNWTNGMFVDPAGVRSDDLTSGPILIGGDGIVRMFFSDSFQKVRQLGPGQNEQLIIGAGRYDIEMTTDFIFDPDGSFASSAFLAAQSQYGFLRVSDTLSLEDPFAVPEGPVFGGGGDEFTPVPVPAALPMSIVAIGALGWLRRRRT